VHEREEKAIASVTRAQPKHFAGRCNRAGRNKLAAAFTRDPYSSLARGVTSLAEAPGGGSHPAAPLNA